VKFAMIFAAAMFVFGACNTHPPATQSAVTAGKATISLSRQADPQYGYAPVSRGYVYVVDQTQHLLVFPAGVRNPVPIRTVNLPVTAISVAADSQGRVYVALWATSTIDVFSSGAAKLLRTITSGLDHPYGISVDDNDDLLVASDGKSGAAVSEYRPGTEKRFASFPIPAPYAVYSVAADPVGNIYAEVYNSPYNFVEEWTNGAWTRLAVAGAGPAAIAFDARGQLVVSAVHTVETFAPPTWKTHSLRNLEVSSSTKWTSRGADGNVYVPVTGPAPYVLVIPSASAVAPWKISLASNPNGATAGI
jgi:hypothetical protein